MTRVQWIFVLALVVVASYGLLEAEQPVRGARADAAQLVMRPVSLNVDSIPSATATTAVTPTRVNTATATVTTTPTFTATAQATLTATNSATPSLTPTAEPTATPTLPPTPQPTPTVQPPPPTNTYLEEPRFIYIDQYNQRLLIYEHGQLLRDIPCSTGLPESDKYTPAARGYVGRYWASFTSFGVEADDAWHLYKSSGNILIHSLPYLRDEAGNKIYQDREALGVRPSSHGCIRIAPEDAAWLTAWNPEGTLFEVSEPYLSKWLAPQ